MSQYCNVCGAENNVGDKFCHNCGSKLVDQGPAKPVNTGFVQSTPPPSSSSPSSSYPSTSVGYQAPPPTASGIPMGNMYAYPPKNEVLALVLSILFVGAGQWYVGRIGRGLAFFFGTIIGYFLIIPGFVIQIWCIIDAYQLAQKYNLFVAQYGRPPTSMDMW